MPVSASQSSRGGTWIILQEILAPSPKSDAINSCSLWDGLKKSGKSSARQSIFKSFNISLQLVHMENVL